MIILLTMVYIRLNKQHDQSHASEENLEGVAQSFFQRPRRLLYPGKRRIVVENHHTSHLQQAEREDAVR